ncbi:alpha-amylase family protein [Actinopolymorpha sp. B9G3]|uniref:alpha-amylase family protein n=1 Tax=Actinopolymorpha sp. B9G3 TaxID=3158970 RepID=UPI0032D95BBF
MGGWVDHAIWWHLLPLPFLGAEPVALPPGAEVRHRLSRLEPWFDYAVELGCSGLVLGPIFASETHGYDTVDHLRIDPRLGDAADFDRLVAAARQRGLRILLDGVFNHVGRGFPSGGQAPEEESTRAAWLRRGPDGRHVTFEGHDRLAALDHDLPAVAAYVIDVMNHWLARGADGWRLDAAYAVAPTFWSRVLPEVRRRNPEAWFVGEMIHGDYAGYVAESGLDSVTQYELWKAIWSSLRDRNFFELAWALERHDSFVEAFCPLTFVGNHDVTRLASRLDRAELVGHALVVLFTVGGVPSVYAGDEQGFRGIKEEREGGDDAIRPVFPDSPAGLSESGWPVYRLHQRLIGLRRRHPWLVHGRSTVEHLTNRAFAYRVTAADTAAAPGGPRSEVVVLMNVADEAYRFPDGLADSIARMVIGASSGPGVEPGEPEDIADPLDVPAYGWRVFVPTHPTSPPGT